MNPIRRILCPVDLSESSARALTYATTLARFYDAAIDALVVRSAGVEPSADDDLQKEAERLLKPAYEGGIPSRVAFAAGDTARQVLHYAESHAADLIVMATRGRQGIERLVLGSVTETVVRKATCPVLTIRSPEKQIPALVAPPFQRVLCPVDFSPPSLHAFERGLALARDMKASVTALHVFEPEREGVNDPPARVRLRQLVPEEAGSHFRVMEVLRTGPVADKILRLAHDDRIDLIVMGVHGRAAIDVAIFGSTTHQVMRRAACPVLTVSAAELLQTAAVSGTSAEAAGS